MRRRALGCLAAGLLAVLGSPAAAAADAPDWLPGRWALVQDTDGSPQDHLEFTADGQVTSISPTGRRLQGRYRLGDGQVQAWFPLPDGTPLPVRMQVHGQRQLRIRSPRTGGTAIYERVER